ncbi:MAG: hypothetical protein Q9205_004133 [Flavoplaca limonia]
MVPYKSSCGKRLIPSLIDQLARDEPDNPWTSVPVSSNLADGFRDISYSILANAVNRAALWIESRCGRSADFGTLLYIGLNDARYFIFFAAAVKTGYKDLLAGDVVPVVPFEKSFAEARHDPCLVLHTSGTTGYPKMIVLTHDALATMDALWLVPPLNGRECFLRTMAANRRIYLAMPFFHMAGFSIAIILSLCSNSVVVFGPGDRPVSVPLVEQVLANANVTCAMLPPSILEEMSKSEAALQRLSLLKAVYYGGASVSRAAGTSIAQRTRLFNQIGSTESVVLITHDTDPEDFQYLHFNVRRNGITFRETSEKGLYEQFVVRDPNVAVHQGPFKIFPNLEEYATKDLYTKHPTKPNHWLFHGRADDVIVFANGEKWNPCGAEAHIRRHPLVSMVLIAGQGRLQPAAIIELTDAVFESNFLKPQLIDNIWPLIVEANSDSPAHCQIVKSHVILSDARKPFQRAGKGTMRRPATLDMYKMELDDLYTRMESGETSSKPDTIDVTNKPALQNFIRSICLAMTGNKELSNDADIFNAGADSLQVIVAVQRIKSRLSSAGIQLEAVTPSLIYSYPTINTLFSSVSGLTKTRYGGTPPQKAPQAVEMSRMMDRYSGQLLRGGRACSISSMDSLVVILTGSTGSLGSYLLDTLMRQENVLKIYCLNRTADGMKRQTASNGARGLSADWTGKDVRFLQADLSKPCFHLERSIYEVMISEVNLVLHNQWQVDFNLILSSFEPHIQGTCNLINFSAKSTRNARIFFMSSVSTIQNWDQRGCKVPEAFLPDLTLPGGGYGQSKAVASLLLEEASRTSGIGGAVIRVGQISGPVRSLEGAWNPQEWLPTLIATSKFLRCLPGDLATMNTIDWVPVDIMAEVLVELALTPVSATARMPQDGQMMRMFHAVNPRSCEWQDLLPAVQESLGQDLPVIPFEGWVQKLQDSVDAKEMDADVHPGVKLTPFFQGMVRDRQRAKESVRLVTTETEQCSTTLRDLEPVRVEWMKIWLKQWGY